LGCLVISVSLIFVMMTRMTTQVEVFIFISLLLVNPN